MIACDAKQAIISAFCRMTRSVYTVCEFQKLKPVGFCVFGEFCGNYKQKNSSTIIRPLYEQYIIRSLHEPQTPTPQ